jgi:DNA-binding MarR family transcriptional regulator
MSVRHNHLFLHVPIEVRALSPDGLRVRAPNAPVADFELVEVVTLTTGLAEELAQRPAANRPLVVSYVRSTAEARRHLREAHVSFIGDDGRVFLVAPGLYVDRDDRDEYLRSSAWSVAEIGDTSTRNPFATKASRVPRWLLLHHHETHTVGELAEAVNLSHTVVSRVLGALDQAALISSSPADDARRREVILARPRELLEAWLPLWQRRRLWRRSWDIGAAGADDALRQLAKVGDRLPPRSWAIGGIAGASYLRKAVEPAEVVMWVDPDDTHEIVEVLNAEPLRDDRLVPGSLRTIQAPDPWILRLADHDDLPVADAVQLWLDCASGGERGIEAAEAIAETMRW